VENYHAKAARYRERAGEVRASAETAKELESRQVLLDLALAYQRIAEAFDTMASRYFSG